MTATQLNNIIASIKAKHPDAYLELLAVGLGAEQAFTEDGKIMTVVMPDGSTFGFPL